jgi:hypothetical protein
MVFVIGLLLRHERLLKDRDDRKRRCGWHSSRGVSPVTFVSRHPGYLSCEANKRGNAHACREVFSGPGNDHQPRLRRRKPDRGQRLAARSDQSADQPAGQPREVEGPWQSVRRFNNGVHGI